MKKTYTTMHRSGFTLIELSIVLIIIGLVIGGILTGQSLIDAAAQRAQVTQVGRYNTAVNTFRNKYGGLPGDLALNLANQFGFQASDCDGTTGNRDGNGFIDGYWTDGSHELQTNGEAALFWQDLSQAGLIDGTFPNSGAISYVCHGVSPGYSLTPGTAYIGDYFPVAKIGNGNFIYVYDGAYTSTNIAGTWSCCFGGQNWFGLSTVTSVLTNGEMFSNPAISVTQAYNIDKKIDDGIPNSGAVQAFYLNAYGAFAANPQASDSATSCYNTTSNNTPSV